MAEALPEGIVARLGEPGAALAAWAREHRRAALAAHEQGVLALVRRARTVGWRPRAVLTVCGPVAMERPWYACGACRRGWSPADATLAAAPRARVSAGVRAHLVALGAATDFREA